MIQFCLRLVHAGGVFPFGFPTQTPCVSVSCVLPKVRPGAICTFRFVPCLAVSSISLCEQWVMKLQGIAESNKLKVTYLLLFRERHSCVCSTMYRVPCTVNSIVCCLDSVTGPAASVRHKAQHSQTHRHWSLCFSDDILWRHTDGAVKQKLAQEIFSYEKEKRLGVQNFRKAVLFALDGSGFPIFFRPVVCDHNPGASGGQTVSRAGRFLEWRTCFQGSLGRLPGTAAHFLRK